MVLKKAMESSDSFQNVMAEVPALNVPQLKARATFEPQFFVKVLHSDDQTEASNNFQPQSILSTQYSLGASKLFSTGTKIEAEIGHSYTDIGFSTLTIPPYYETTGKIVLSQNLWHNSFGYGTRRLVQSSKLMTKANRITFEENIEQWTLGLVQLYYNAWLAKAQALLGADNLKRRLKLLKITRIKNKRGTAEEQDLLQIQSAFLNAEVQKEQSDEALNSIWRELVIALKLPEEWLSLDPKEIPMVLDSPVEAALSVCKSKKAPPRSDSSVEKATLMSEAARLDLERTRNAMAPNLDLQFQLNGNGINVQRGHSMDEAFRVDNPAWAVGVQLQVPLHRYSEEADYRSAITKHIRAEANSSYQKGQLKLKWINACTELLRLENAHKKISKAHQNQSRRANLEERRFSIGRTPTINVIQAEDDATRAQSLLNQTESQMRTAAWKVRQLKGEIPSFLTKLGFDPKKITAEILYKKYEDTN